MENEIEPTEKKRIEELRSRMNGQMKHELLKDDNLFLRFLRARDGNINKAEVMIQNYLKWRLKYDVDNIQEFKAPEVYKYVPFSTIGFDKSGALVRYTIVTNFDTQGFLKSMEYDDSVKCFIKVSCLDEIILNEQNQKNGTINSQWMYIVDFENYSLFKYTQRNILKFYADVVKVYADDFPERMKTMFVINASRSFTMVYNFISPFLTKRTLSKFHIFGKDGWKEELVKHIDAEILPAFLGGNRTDPDGNPLCHSFINRGGIIPESYYLKNDSCHLRNQPDIEKLEIPSRTKRKVILDIKQVGSVIEWKFQSQGGDINFGLYLQPLDQNRIEEVVPSRRLDADVNVQNGVYHCEALGTYILMFDNSYSWMRAKEIFYNVQVHTKDDELPYPIGADI